MLQKEKVLQKVCRECYVKLSGARVEYRATFDQHPFSKYVAPHVSGQFSPQSHQPQQCKRSAALLSYLINHRFLVNGDNFLQCCEKIY